MVTHSDHHTTHMIWRYRQLHLPDTVINHSNIEHKHGLLSDTHNMNQIKVDVERRCNATKDAILVSKSKHTHSVMLTT